MNIAVFSDTYPPFINGVSTSVFNLVKMFRDRGHNVLVVTPRSNDGPLEVKDNIIYMPGVENKKLYGYRFPKFYDKRVMEMVKEFKPDVIHYHTDSMLGVFARLASKKLKVPLVYTYHTSYEDYTYYATKGFLDRAAKKVVRVYTKAIARGCAELITPSYKTKEYLRSTGSDIYINVIPTGIDFSLFDRNKIDVERTRQFKIEHHIDDDTKIFLILGRVAKEKSMDVSIRGYAKFKETYPEIKTKLIVVGGGPAKTELELLSHELRISDTVDFIGPVPSSDTPFYYHLADIYTSASVTETQGLTFMEAMAASNIVLARLDDNLSGTIIDGQTGYFFTNDESFVEKAYRILNLSKEQKDKIISNALKQVDMYSIDNFYKNVLEVYQRAIKKYW